MAENAEVSVISEDAEVSVISKATVISEHSVIFEDAGIVEDSEDAGIVSNSHILDNTLPRTNNYMHTSQIPDSYRDGQNHICPICHGKSGGGGFFYSRPLSL